MLSQRSLLVALLGLGLSAPDAYPAIIYRIGTPFSAAAKDSLRSSGIDFREIEWSSSQLQEALELDSLQAGSLQPNFFDTDEDIAATLFSRDGWVGVVTTLDSYDKQVGHVLIDGDPSTAWVWPSVAPESFDLMLSNPERFDRGVVLDLGGRFLIREVRLRPLEERPDHFIEKLIFGVSDRGFNTVQYVPDFPTIAEIVENTEPEVRVVLDPPLTTEVVQVRVFRQTPKELGIADVEVYGGGFVRKASYRSDIIEQEDIASLGEIRWSGRRDRMARVEIRTRTGADPQPEIFWESRPEQQDSVKFLGGGGDLSLSEYKRLYGRLSDFLKPVVAEDTISPDTENWSFWSSPYAFENPDIAIVSPSPRQFLQISADFTSTIDDGGKIDFIEFKASVPPAVRRLVGEIYPTETEVGEPTHFTYYIRPTIRSGDTSFDGVEISTLSGVMSVDSLRIDGIDQEGFSWRTLGDGRVFEVMLPRKLEPVDSGALVEVVFTAAVLREVGTQFDGKIFDTSRPNEVRQRIIPGNAAEEVEGDRLSVTTSLSSSLVFSLRVSPNPFTPNGDGVNDAVTITYKLLRVTSAVPVSFEVFYLSGRRLKRVYHGVDALGEYSHIWDGTDDSNKLVPPGIFLYRLVVDLQSERETTSGLLSVVY